MNQPHSPEASARMAVGLMIGFYAVGLAFVALLLYVPSSPLLEDYWARPLALIAFYVIAGIFLIALLPWPTRFRPPGELLERHRHPALFAFIDEVTDATATPAPDEVYITFEASAGAIERRGPLGIGRRRVLGIGLMLLPVLSVAQLRALIAHELAHLQRGDSRLGGWVYKTRRSLDRSYDFFFHQTMGKEPGDIAQLLKKPFQWYARTFLRITSLLSRQRELAADELAARVAGIEVTISTLERVMEATLVFPGYMTFHLGPVFSARMLPPVAEGFRRCFSAPQVTEWLAEEKKKVFESPESDPYDAHPSLPERIAAIVALADTHAVALPQEGQHRSASAASEETEGAAVTSDALTPEAPDLLPEPDESALSLLSDPVAVEAQMFRIETGKGKERTEAPRVLWEDVGVEVWKPGWQGRVNAYAEALSGLTPAMVPEAEDLHGRLASCLPPAVRHEMSNTDRAVHATEVVHAALCTALLHDGWEVRVNPGEPTELSKAGKTIRPREEMDRIFVKEEWAEEWVALMTDWGIADVDLGALAEVDAKPETEPGEETASG